MTYLCSCGISNIFIFCSVRCGTVDPIQKTKDANRLSFGWSSNPLLVLLHTGATAECLSMSLFEGRQPAMFDVKKRIGNIERTTLDEADSAPESWVELAPSRASMCSSVDAIIVDADTAAKDYSRQSPISIQSPHVEFEPNLEQVKFRLTRDVLPPARSTDWIWDWSSRPEAIPPRTVRQRSAQLDSTLSTPPNSPEPESASLFEYGKNKSLFRLDIIFGFMVSNIVTFVIGAAIGYVCNYFMK
uniref:Uncharacterized protein n=1 Tax=Parascaris univalens TaxID=6257 RepID=A0A915C727_PARUN